MNTIKNIMSAEQLDDGSMVINFDQEDDDGICNTGGYVMVRQEDEEFYITAFDGQGNLVNEYRMDYQEAFNGE